MTRSRTRCSEGTAGRRQQILLETLAKLEEASPTAHYHTLALRNLQRWAEQRDGAQTHGPGARCKVHVLPGDWGEVTHHLTSKYGVIFASLNMANAYGPGGGYTHGMVAQEENMFRRTDCHVRATLPPVPHQPDQ